MYLSVWRLAAAAGGDRNDDEDIGNIQATVQPLSRANWTLVRPAVVTNNILSIQRRICLLGFLMPTQFLYVVDLIFYLTRLDC